MPDNRQPTSGPNPLVLLLCILAPPLGLLAWVFGSGAHRPAYLRSGWVRTGLTLLLLQKPGEALEELQAVAAAAPGAVEPQTGLARALAALGRFGEAAAAQSQAVEIAAKTGRADLGSLRSCLQLYQQGRPCPAS